MRYIDQYIAEQSVAISEAIAGRKIIYLDLKYWILLRDGLNSGQETTTYKLANKLIELYESKKCIFPVSEVVFWEMMKQYDKTSLLKTFQLVEKLSEGIAILSDKQRVKIEFSCWYSTNVATDKKLILNQFVWSKLPLISGYLFYSHKVEELPDALKMSFLDFVCHMPLSVLIEQPQFSHSPFTGRDNVKLMNSDKEKYKHENKNRTEMFFSELWGVLDCFGDQFNEVIQELYQKMTWHLPTAEEIANTDKTSWQKLIYQCFKLGKVTTQFPTAKITAALAGSMRWNKNRKYTDGNDTLDIMHAAIALPYCDYFFTERELHTIIGQEKLDTLFQCQVESMPEAILATLNAL
ncbi:hypothetical protein [Mucilaginibacter sp.]|uniref:hypothetical protein n=1 Tax=Mucilaginibacter sp. TaxID=1882438 RepID=UPI0035BBA472